ncbi:hypothetical protein WAI453_005035 [Rhynchosporium graminicola]
MHARTPASQPSRHVPRFHSTRKAKRQTSNTIAKIALHGEEKTFHLTPLLSSRTRANEDDEEDGYRTNWLTRIPNAASEGLPSWEIGKLGKDGERGRDREIGRYGMADKLEFEGVVLDIEGTVCPISFVKDVLMPNWITHPTPTPSDKCTCRATQTLQLLLHDARSSFGQERSKEKVAYPAIPQIPLTAATSDRVPANDIPFTSPPWPEHFLPKPNP